jgi:hypothetical protein
MNKVDVVHVVNGDAYHLGFVLISNARDEKDRREENELFAMSVVYEAVPTLVRYAKLSEGQAYLQALRAVVTAQYSQRDEAAEYATSTRLLNHYGFHWLKERQDERQG